MGAAGAVAAVGLSGPARAAGHAGSVAAMSGPRFDRELARELQRALRDALRDPSVHAPGAILHCAARGSAAGAAPPVSVAWHRPNRFGAAIASAPAAS